MRGSIDKSGQSHRNIFVPFSIDRVRPMTKCGFSYPESTFIQRFLSLKKKRVQKLRQQEKEEATYFEFIFTDDDEKYKEFAGLTKSAPQNLISRYPIRQPTKKGEGAKILFLSCSVSSFSFFLSLSFHSLTFFPLSPLRHNGRGI